MREIVQIDGYEPRVDDGDVVKIHSSTQAHVCEITGKRPGEIEDVYHLQTLPAVPDDPEHVVCWLRESFLRANKNCESYEHGAVAITLIYDAKNKRIYVAYVGDCESYLVIREKGFGRVLFLSRLNSRLHNVDDPQINAKLVQDKRTIEGKYLLKKPCKLSEVPRGVQTINSFGDNGFNKSGHFFEPTVEWFQLELPEGYESILDIHAVLNCDGLSENKDTMNLRIMRDLIEANMTSQYRAVDQQTNMAQVLVNAAYAGGEGSEDNISVLWIPLEGQHIQGLVIDAHGKLAARPKTFAEQVKRELITQLGAQQQQLPLEKEEKEQAVRHRVPLQTFVQGIWLADPCPSDIAVDMIRGAYQTQNPVSLFFTAKESRIAITRLGEDYYRTHLRTFYSIAGQSSFAGELGFTSILRVDADLELHSDSHVTISMNSTDVSEVLFGDFAALCELAQFLKAINENLDNWSRCLTPSQIIEINALKLNLFEVFQLHGAGAFLRYFTHHLPAFGVGKQLPSEEKNNSYAIAHSERQKQLQQNLLWLVEHSFFAEISVLLEKILFYQSQCFSLSYQDRLSVLLGIKNLMERVINGRLLNEENIAALQQWVVFEIAFLEFIYPKIPQTALPPVLKAPPAMPQLQQNMFFLFKAHKKVTATAAVLATTFTCLGIAVNRNFYWVAGVTVIGYAAYFFMQKKLQEPKKEEALRLVNCYEWPTELAGKKIETVREFVENDSTYEQSRILVNMKAIHAILKDLILYLDKVTLNEEEKFIYHTFLDNPMVKKFFKDNNSQCCAILETGAHHSRWKALHEKLPDIFNLEVDALFGAPSP